MDPITLIVTALAAGAALGAQDTVSAIVKDAYAGLKDLVKKRLAGRPSAELVLAKHEQAPETWQAPLMAELADTGAGGDRDLIAAAQALLDLIGGLKDGRESTRSMRDGHRRCRSGTTTGRTTCSMPHGRLGAAMTTTGGPDNCCTKVRVKRGHSPGLLIAASEITVFTSGCGKKQRAQERPLGAGGRVR
jgi:hypothetical protein